MVAVTVLVVGMLHNEKAGKMPYMTVFVVGMLQDGKGRQNDLYDLYDGVRGGRAAQ